jgi:hypothetical protein
MLNLGRPYGLELRCTGPVTAALFRAMEYGIRVRSWALREDGLVALRCASKYAKKAERWYRASVDRRQMGALVCIARVVIPHWGGAMKARIGEWYLARVGRGGKPRLVRIIGITRNTKAKGGWLLWAKSERGLYLLTYDRLLQRRK